MESIKIANSYTKILFDIAVSDGKASEIFEDIKIISLAIKASKNFSRFLSAPIYRSNAKLELMQEFLNHFKIEKKVQNFVKVLVENNRINLLPRICNYYERKLFKSNGKEIATITLAKKISKEEFEKIRILFEERLDKKFEAYQEVDEKIVGGAVVTFGHSMCDLSLNNIQNKLIREINEI